VPESSSRFISGIILAAGKSERLGRPKQLALLGGEPVLRHVIRQALRSCLNEVIVVLGHEAERIASAVGEMGQRTIINLNYAAGQSTSLRAGLNAIDPRAGAVIVLLGDQPRVDPALIDRLIERFQATGARIVRPVYAGCPGNPVLFARSLFPELMAVTGDEGARSLIQRLRHEVALVPVDGPPPRDLDTEDDYRLLAAEWGE
jgi:molybdenum cofactor cytidylyltransferase